MQISKDELRELESRGLTPRCLLKHLIKGKKLSESIYECLVNPPEGQGLSPKYAERLVQKYSYTVERMLMAFTSSMIPLYEISNVLEKTMQLDTNWMMSVVCLAAQDAASKKIAEKLEIPLKFIDQEGRTIYKSSIKLLEDIATKLTSKGEKPSKLRASLKVAKVYSEEFRNKVIHEGEPIDSETASHISEATTSLLKELFLTSNHEQV